MKELQRVIEFPEMELCVTFFAEGDTITEAIGHAFGTEYEEHFKVDNISFEFDMPYDATDENYALVQSWLEENYCKLENAFL